MKKIKLAFAWMLGLMLITSCQGQNLKPQKLEPDAFEAKLIATKDKTILDVRTPEEFAKGHLENAVLINFYNDDFNSQVNKLDKTKPVFVYCGSGIRSGKASEILIKEKFNQVYDLAGGISAWTNSKKTLVK